MQPIRTALIGPHGQIGWELVRALPDTHRVIGLTRAQVDLADPNAIRRTLRDLHPDLIINAAGYTAVDRAESEPEMAAAVNATALGVIGEEACRLGAAVVHFSTDYVFDGIKRTPYTPADTPNPLNVYGRTKLRGEHALVDSGAAALILRTSWVYGFRGRNFLLTILKQAANSSQVRIVDDQTGTPTWCRHIAQATAQIIARSLCGGPGRWSFGRVGGTYHVAARGSTTWYGFARAALSMAGGGFNAKLVPITSDEFAAAARRPAFSVLDGQLTEDTFGVLMADWRTALQDSFRGGAASAALTELRQRESPDESVQPIEKETEPRPNHFSGRGRVGIDWARSRQAG